MAIQATEVIEVMEASMFKEKELENPQPEEMAIRVNGITSVFAFHPQRLESHRKQVADWLRQLPLPFQPVSAGGGGGWSFLQACVDQDDNHWAEHKTMEALFVLGMGLGLAHYALPRDFWPMLPGGMPYMCVFPDGADEKLVRHSATKCPLSELLAERAKLKEAKEEAAALQEIEED